MPRKANKFIEQEVEKLKKVGRPDEYTIEIGEEICALLAQGKSLKTVCSDEKMPSIPTVFAWMRKYPEFLNKYAEAKAQSAEADHEMLKDLGDEAIRLAQELKGANAGAVVQAVKLKADNLKWSMARMKPKKYGEHVDITTDGEKIAVLPTEIYAKHNAARKPGKDS